MPKYRIEPTGVERFFDERDLIVTKTDLKGRITYSNKVFRDIVGFTGRELDGAPHSLIRHPEMPRCVFKLLWDTIESGREIFAYVNNLCANGDNYWVFAHVTPSFDDAGKIIGYHSNRRVPKRSVVTDIVQPLYRQVLQVEQSQADRKTGMQAGLAAVTQLLTSKGVTYDEFVLSL